MACAREREYVFLSTKALNKNCCLSQRRVLFLSLLDRKTPLEALSLDFFFVYFLLCQDKRKVKFNRIEDTFYSKKLHTFANHSLIKRYRFSILSNRF